MDRLWAENDESRTSDDPALVVDVDGFEGPLDLLLHLARNQKVDLARISILALAEQYLLFIEKARTLRLELAADYLVMAAWLAYLKSKLLIPKQPGEEGESGEELAAVLQFRLKRLEAMRDAAARLVNRNRLGRDVFARGMPELVIVEKRNEYSATLYDLLTAYAVQRQRQAITNVQIAKRGVWSLKEAREILTRLIGRTARLDGARPVPDRISDRARRIARPRSPAPLPRASNSSARARSRCARRRPSRRSICAAGSRQESPLRWYHERKRQRFRRSFPFVEADEDEAEIGTPARNPAERLHLAEAVRMAEAIVFASAEPVSEKQLAQRLPDGIDVPAAMAELQQIYARRGVNLSRSATPGPSAPPATSPS